MDEKWPNYRGMAARYWMSHQYHLAFYFWCCERWCAGCGLPTISITGSCQRRLRNLSGPMFRACWMRRRWSPSIASFRWGCWAAGGIGGGGVNGIMCGSGDAWRAKDKGALVHPAIGGTAEEETNDGTGLCGVITSVKKSMIKDGKCGSRNNVWSIIPLTPEQLQPLYVTMSDFLLEIPYMQPSSKHNGFATVIIKEKNDLMRKLAELDMEDANDNECVPPSPTPM